MQTDWSLFMKELLETKQELEQVILVGICTQENDDTEESLKELAELVETAGAHPLTMVIQNRESIHPGTYVGKGKIEIGRASCRERV